MFSHFCIRSKDEWVVEQDKYRFLKASAGDDPLHPPTTGWLFRSRNTLFDTVFEEDKSLTCAPPNGASSPCCVTVNICGPAREAVGQCEGVYYSTDLMSAGRKV